MLYVMPLGYPWYRGNFGATTSGVYRPWKSVNEGSVATVSLALAVVTSAYSSFLEDIQCSRQTI